MNQLDQKLIDRIEEAKRVLRVASGVPLTEEEAEQERRLKAVAELSHEATDISMGTGLNLYASAAWENGAAIKVQTFSSPPGRPTFLLRLTGNDFQLFQKMTDGTESLLTVMPRKDPQIANKILVAVGDALTRPGEDGKA